MKASKHRSLKGWLDRFCDGTELFFRALGGVAGAILAILLLWIVDPTDWHLLSLPLLPLVGIVGFGIGFFYDEVRVVAWIVTSALRALFKFWD